MSVTVAEQKSCLSCIFYNPRENYCTLHDAYLSDLKACEYYWQKSGGERRMRIVRITFKDHFRLFESDLGEKPKPMTAYGELIKEDDEYYYLRLINAEGSDPPWYNILAIYKPAVVSVDELLPLSSTETHIHTSLRRDYEED